MTTMQETLFTVPPDPTPVVAVCPTCHGCGSVTLDMTGKVGDNHPSTSRKARTAPNRLRWGTQRYQALAYLARFGPSTAAEVADSMGVSRNQCATRLLECREAGWVTYLRDESGVPVEDRTSEDASGLVQQITDAGRAVIAETEARRG